MGRLDDKVAIITGGAGGQGASHARKFVEEGAKVVIGDVDEEKGKKLADELGENTIFVKHDVSSAEQWENIIDQGENTFGNINTLVNNAGFTILNRVEDVSEEEYRKVIDVNQIGTFLGIKSVIPSMKKAGGGSIMNIASVSGLAGSPSGISYDSSKFAVTGMTKSAALDLAEYDIRVNSVHPGSLDTDFFDENTREIGAEAVKTTPLGRFAEKEEVSNLLIFLASDESSYSTGSEFVLDGGLTASP